MGKSLLLRLNGLNITVLYEGGGRQQVTVPSPCSRSVQRWKEIPEAKKGKKEGDKDNMYMDNEEDIDNRIQKGDHRRKQRLQRDEKTACLRNIQRQIKTSQ